MSVKRMSLLGDCYYRAARQGQEPYEFDASTVQSMRLPEGCLEVIFTDFGSQNREFHLAFCRHGTVS